LFGALRRQCAHGPDESIAAFRNGFDEPRAVLAVAERLPKDRDVLVEVVLVHEGVGPEELHQLLLSDQAAAALDQELQGVEDFGSERHRLTVSRQEAFGGKQPVGAERVALKVGHGAPRRRFQRNFSFPASRGARKNPNCRSIREV
jgi:hypothetical protein